jgi:hypothetical protein
MKKSRLFMMIAAVVIAVGGAFATNQSKKFFVTSYVLAAPTSCQMTSPPADCNTSGGNLCEVQGNTHYQSACFNAFRRF